MTVLSVPEGVTLSGAVRNYCYLVGGEFGDGSLAITLGWELGELFRALPSTLPRKVTLSE